MTGFLKAAGLGVLAVGGEVSMVAGGISLLWGVGTGDISGWPAILCVALAIVMLVMGVLFLAMIGDAMEHWEGGR